METIDYLPLVKAYPALSRKYGEVSCIAGVRLDGPGGPAWIRLYPVPFRSLESEKQFKKYQPIRLRVGTHAGDRRPETRRPDRDSIETLGEQIDSRGDWDRRRRFVEPLLLPSMCEIERRRKQDGTSLGAFRPKRVVDIVIEATDVRADKQEIARAFAAQPSLLDGIDAAEQANQIRELDHVPYRFKYRYECDDHGCSGHTQSIIDWEIVTYYRRIRDYDDWRERLKARWIGDLCAPGRDTAFFVGNMHQHPNSFLVLGVWWPPRKPEQLGLGI